MKKFICGFIVGMFIAGIFGVYAANEILDNPYPIYVNGEQKQICGYNIDGATYFKLRDIAKATNGFNVDFQNNNIIIDTTSEYIDEDQLPIQQINEAKKTYYDYLNDAEIIPVKNNNTEMTDYVNVNDLLYYVVDVNNDGVEDLAFTGKNEPLNGLGILTIDNGFVKELVSPSLIPYSSGVEDYTLASYNGQYGIFYHRWNSADNFRFKTIGIDGEVTTLFYGWHDEIDAGYTINNEYIDKQEWWSIFNSIDCVTFYDINQLNS